MKFKLSYERRKALNEWAIANDYHPDIPKFFNRKWLDHYGYADKNAVYEYMEAHKRIKDAELKQKIKHYSGQASSILKMEEMRYANLSGFTFGHEKSMRCYK